MLYALSYIKLCCPCCNAVNKTNNENPNKKTEQTNSDIYYA